MEHSMHKCNLTKSDFAFAPVPLQILLRLLTFLCAFYAIRADAVETTEATLPEVVVSVSPRGADQEHSDGFFEYKEQPNSEYFAERDLAIAHERSIDEVLRGHPGIGVTKGGASGLGLLQVRGVGGQGMVSLDGMPVPDTLPGVLNLNALLPEAQESIRINRGFGYASRPFSALGGSVDLTSRSAREDSADLRVEGGTFGFLKETLRGNLAGERARLAVTVNRTDAFDGAYHAQKSNDNPERDPYHSNQVLAKASVDLSDTLLWEGSLLYRDARNDWDGYGIRNGMFAMADEKDSFFAEESWMAQNTIKAYINEDWDTRLQLGYTHTDNQAKVMGLRLGYTTDFYLARWENSQRLWHGQDGDAIHLIWGAEGRHEWAEAPTYGPPPALAQGAPFTESRNQQAGFVETRFAFGKFSGDAGVRYESYDRFQSHALVHAALAWQALDTLKLRANGGNGFRIPSYAEKLFPLLGNPNLKPERGAGGDLGLEWQALANLKLSLTGFYTRYDDLISVSWEPQPTAQLPCIGECISNIANAIVAGLEAGSDLVFNEQWRGGASYTYNDSRNLGNGRRLPFQAPHSVRVWGEWRVPNLPLTLWAEGIYRSLSRNDLGNTLDVDDAFRLNIHANYQVTPKLDLYVRGENVSNDKTPDVYSFDHTGAMVYGGISYRL
jgi:vitamin B12 transporter